MSRPPIGRAVLAGMLLMLPPPVAAQTAPAAIPAAATATWPADQWWTGYADPQLAALITEGLKGATDLRVADARYRAAAAQGSAAHADLFPTLGASGSAGYAKQSYNYLFPAAFAPKGWLQTGQVGLNLDWQIDFWGRNRAALAAARADQAAAGAEAAAARLAVSTGIAAAYADMAALYAEQDAAQDAVKVRAATLDLITRRQAEGLENTGAVARARAGLASARAEQAAIAELIELARNRLAALIGAGPERGQAITRPAVSVTAPADLPANLPADLVGRRPDIAAARARALAASARIRVAKAAFYPNVNLSAMVGLQALGLDRVFNAGSDMGSVGPAITLPIFDAGRLTARKHGAQAEYDAAVAQYDGALINALREVADATASRRALSTRLAETQAAQAAAQAAYTVASNRYRGGLATYLDVLTAQDALIAARRATATLQTRAFALDVALIRALGGGYRA
ncbi:efflux transporter outer membrane subunit [Novosphingobium ovatum]|uniref:efflux transporter outer membrane subunit n=1 Tax=Novosphingobium ovatum TaxID=1908523 RepID=UPI0029FEDE7E|nr:efflux transporter outer membrane subunit [Novosphingobium ovatum]